MISRSNGLTIRNTSTSASTIQRMIIGSNVRFGRRSPLRAAGDEGIAAALSALMSTMVMP